MKSTHDADGFLEVIQRRVYVDDSKSPGTLWIGSNHGASIVKIEPLD